MFIIVSMFIAAFSFENLARFSWIEASKVMNLWALFFGFISALSISMMLLSPNFFWLGFVPSSVLVYNAFAENKKGVK
jgi:hypothetical protein